MESYFAAKRRLFDRLKPGGRAVVNVDDPYGRRLAAELPDALTFGEAAGAVRAADVVFGPDGIRGRLVTPRGELPLASPLARPLQPLEPARRRRGGRGAGPAARRGRRGVRRPAAGSRAHGAGRPRPAVPGVRRLRPHRRGAGGGAALGARGRGRAGGGGLRLRRRARPRQAPAHGAGRRRAGRPADRHLRQPARRGPARHPRRREEGLEASGNRRLPRGARPPRGDPRGDRRGRARAGRCWWPARGTRRCRSSATARSRSRISREIGKALEERFGAAARVDEAAPRDGRAAARRRSRARSSTARPSTRARSSGGELFFAFPGERTDGHRFVERRAGARGRAAAVVERGGAGAGSGRGLRSWSRTPSRPSRPWRGTCAQRVPRTARRASPARPARPRPRSCSRPCSRPASGPPATPGNLNNLYRLPAVRCSTCRTAPSGWSPRWGCPPPASWRELSRSAARTRRSSPSCGPSTWSSSTASQAIAEAKAELLAGLAPGGLVVANADDPEVARIARERAPAARAWSGTASSRTADVRARRPRAGGRGRGRAAASRSRPAASGRRSACRSTASTTSRTAWRRRPAPGRSACSLGRDRRGGRGRQARPRCAASSTASIPAGASRWSTTPTTRTPTPSARRSKARRSWPGERRGRGARRHARAGAGGAALPPRGGRAGGAARLRAGRRGRRAVARARGRRRGRRGRGALVRRRRGGRRVGARGELRPGDVVLVKGSRGVGLEVVVRRLRRDGEGH